MNKSQLNELNVPKLRFKGFEEEWFRKKISDVLNYEQPTNYLVTNEKYLGDNSLLPVLTAGKTFILGYTNDFNNSYNKGNVIIIDDFTLDIRYINFAFKIKSSAIKLLTAKYDNLYFIFLTLKIHKIRPTGHNRHYISIIKNLNINIPSVHEQEKIAHFFSLLDKQIELYETKLQLNELKYSFYTSALLKKIITKNKCKLSKYLIPVKSCPILNLENKTPISISLYGKGLKESSLKIKLSNSGRPYFLRQEGELIIGAQNFHNGSVAILGNAYINPIMSNAIYSFNTTHIESKILLKIFLSHNFKNILNRISSGTGQKEVSLKQILNIDFFEIDIELSKLCTKIFDIYDSKIYLMKKNIELLKIKKAYYLRKLFI